MSSRRLSRLLVVLLGFSGLLLSGCSDGCGCDLLPGTRDWFIEIDVGPIPDPVPEYPTLVHVRVDVRNLETGALPPDGLLATLSVTPGTFDNGRSEIELPLVNGRTTAILEIDRAGVYELTVSLAGEGHAAHATFNVGL